MKQATSQWLLVLATLLLCSSTSAIIPKKHWSEIGYEAFNRKEEEESKAVTSARKAATPAKSGGLTRAVFGVGVASALATVGGKRLGEQKPELALLDALRKPVVAVGPPPQKISTDGASIPSHVFNLVKGIVGVGVLSLPAGVAAFGNAPSAVIPATVLISVIGMLSAFGFYLIGKVCAYTGAQSFREAWAKSVGEGSSWIPAWTVTFKTFFACLAFSMVLADTFASIVGSARNDTLLTITGFVLLPLCLKKDLKSLAPFSLLGVIGMAYTTLAMTVRFFDGSYAIGAESQGKFIESIESFLRPKFGNAGMESVFSPNALMLVCMLSTAYMVCAIEIAFIRVHSMLSLVCTSAAKFCILILTIFIVPIMKSGPLQCTKVLPRVEEQHSQTIRFGRQLRIWSFYSSYGIHFCSWIFDLWGKQCWCCLE